MAELQLTIEQLQSRMDAVGDIGGASRSFRQLIRAIRTDLVRETKENFVNARSPDGSPWASLAHPRPNSKGNDRPLQDTGMLRTSVTSAFSSHNVNREEDYGFEWGTNFEYAWVHQAGATIQPVNAKWLAIPATMKAKHTGSPRNMTGLKFRFGKKGGVALLNDVIQYYFTKQSVIPARPFLGITEQMASRYEEMVADWYESAVIAKIQGGLPQGGFNG